MNKKNLHKNLINTFEKVQKNNLSLEKFLEMMLTPSEINDIGLRLEILKRLQAGDTQRNISESLGVGIATVTRGSKQLKELDRNFQDLLK